MLYGEERMAHFVLKDSKIVPTVLNLNRFLKPKLFCLHSLSQSDVFHPVFSVSKRARSTEGANGECEESPASLLLPSSSATGQSPSSPGFLVAPSSMLFCLRVS